MSDGVAGAQNAKYEGIFATPLIVSEIEDAETIVPALKHRILERAKTHPSSSRSNQGGWQSDTTMLHWAGEPAVNLVKQILQTCARFTRDTEQTDPEKPRFEWGAEMWANICPPSVGHESHTHPGSMWSIVFYLDNGLGVGEDSSRAGSIVLQDPLNPTPVMYKPDLRMMQPDGSTYRSDRRITPKVGQMIAFPSWVSHWVTPHRGSQNRMSIAVNMIAMSSQPR